MRALLVAVLAAILLAIGWWSMANDTVPAPVPSEPDSRAPNAAPAAAVAGETAREPAQPAANVPAEETPPTAGEPSPTAKERQDGKTSATITAVDATTQQPIPSFRYRLEQQGGRIFGNAQAGAATVAVARIIPFDLFVEADGYDPSQVQGSVLGSSDQGTPITVELTRSAGRAAGITLLATDQAREPVTNLLVQAFALPDAAAAETWRIAAPLWSRRTGNQAGKYVLPALGQGRFAIRAMVADALGKPLPFLPFEGTFELSGSNGYVETYVPEAGCIPELELVDRFGQPLAGGEQGPLLHLSLPGGPAISRQWLARSDDKLLRALDRLPATGAVWPEVPMSAGVWQLDVQREGYAPHHELVTLTAGDRPKLRIATPW
jgi:hypothetical protein